jgi:tRNA(His) 5'-end guanylyltransferase
MKYFGGSIFLPYICNVLIKKHMQFNNLKERMEYYKSIYDYRLTPNSYVLAHIDGRSFSKLVKKRFERPFDNEFIRMMNETAEYLCKEIQGCKTAYVQSDEISLVITDFDTPESDSFFGFRLCKMQSIIASLATAKFNQLNVLRVCDVPCSNNDLKQIIASEPIVQFDCKVWTVPTYNDVFAWLLYRQNDCLRNSKQQTAQTYLPHKRLVGLKADEQIELLNNEKDADWNALDNGKKYGRIVYKETETFNTTIKGEPVSYERSIWKAHYAELFTNEYFDQLNIIPKR